ncbi:hypothetical protein BRC88_13500 [Halobacteriales archaeon QS_4_69_225]|nr:MAG: hypothetical protein BRC88_13500 [Halobacteriales archaeon QS_4_69_225]
MRLDDGVLHLDKEFSLLDEFVIDVTSILDDLGVGYVVVSGYVAILTGRSRSTEDIDTIIEPLSSEGARDLASRLRDEGYWGATALARIDGHEVNVGPLEQQIAYKLFLGTEKDFEDSQW